MDAVSSGYTKLERPEEFISRRGIVSERTSEEIIKLSHSQAREFFLKPESYFTVEIPNYIDLKSILEIAVKTLGDSELAEISKERNAQSNSENINYKLFISKGAKFTWRPVSMIHPIAYVDLVNFLTKEDVWDFVVKCFRDFSSNPKIICSSIPVKSNNANTLDKGEQISAWWHKFEQEQIKLALEYEYCIHTDITDCYPSIYTHSIAWAIHGRQEAKRERKNKDSKGNIMVGNCLDAKIKNLQNGQTNGIPQGSVVMDFIAEIVLGYADLLLSEQIEKLNLNNENYKILRYRDDYRIFGNKLEIVEKIMKLLTETLMALNLKINSNKTFLCKDIVLDSIKPEKLYWTEKKNSFYNLSTQKHLLQIKLFADKFPNSGQLLLALTEFYKFRIYNLTQTQNDIEQLLSITISIMKKNPRAIVQCVTIVAKLLSLIDESEVEKVVNQIINKYALSSNLDYIELWLQRITVVINRDFEFKSLLCKKISNPEGHTLWNSEWLKKGKKLDESTLIDQKRLNECSLITNPSEIRIFNSYSI